MIIHHNVTELGLRIGDRLEPSPELIDVAAFFDRPIGFTAIFWRASKDGRNRVLDAVNRRNQIFCLPGCDPSRILMVDSLHTLHLGTYANYIKHIFWLTLDHNVWRLDGNRASIIEHGVRALWSDLCEWYVANSIDVRYRVKNPTPKMMGTDESRTLKTKAGENGVLLHYALDLARRHEKDFIDGDVVVEAGECLTRFAKICKESPRKMSDKDCSNLVHLAVRHIQLAEIIELSFIPKMHLMVHLAQRARWAGNPRLHSCFHDESLNRTIATIASTGHRLRWMRSMFFKTRLLPFVDDSSTLG
jgi:hypothetical protein